MNLNLLSVDLEDWYTSAYLRDYVSKEECSPRIVESTVAILDLFNSKNVKATFFVLGTIAEKEPELIRRISSNSHEIASHGYSHTPLWNLTPAEFKKEIRLANQILQDITGKKVIGYRAPYASLEHKTAWAITVLEEEGFKYDSSLFPMRTPIYGVSGNPLAVYRISRQDILKHTPEATLIEIPFTVLSLGPFKIPCTGGIYGRFLPTPILKLLLRQVVKSQPINFYFHPWESYSDIPRVAAPIYNRVVSYYNTSGYLAKIESVIGSFNFTSFEHFLTAREEERIV